MNGRQIRCFVQVARSGNITHAAKELYLTQQALSQVIQTIEKEIGILLFHRHSNGIELTEFGREIYPQCVIMCEQIDVFDKFLERKQQSAQQELLILVQNESVSLAFLPEVLKNYGRNVSFKVEVSLNKGVKHIKRNKLSSIFCLKPRDLGDVNFRPIFREEFVVLASKQSELAQKETLSIEDILKETILLPATSTTYISHLTNIFMRHGAIPKFASESPSVSLVLGFVKAGLGIKISPMYALKSYDLKDIAVIPFLNEAAMTGEFGFVYSGEAENLDDNMQELFCCMENHYKKNVFR